MKGDEEKEELMAMELIRALELNTHNRTTDMMNTNSVASRSVSSLTKVIGCLDDTNQVVVQILLLSKRHIIGSRELVELIRDYFNCSQKTLDFLNALHAWLHGGTGVTRRVDRLKSTLKEFKEDKSKLVYVQTRVLNHALESFLKANDSLAIEQLRSKLCVVLDDQKRLCERLQAKKQEVDHQNMGRFHLYRRLTTAVLFSVYMGLFVCAIMTAILSPALVAAPLAAIAAVASMNPTEYMRTLMNSLLDKYKDKITRRSEVVNELMEANSRMTLDDLEGIRFVVQALRDKIQSFSVNIATVVNVRKDSVVNHIIKDMEKKIDEFVKAVKDLESRKEKCYKDVTDARAKIIRTTFR